MENNFICPSLLIVLMLVNIYGGVQIIRRKLIKFVIWHWTGRREIIYEGRAAVMSGFTQILICLSILLGIVALNMNLFGNFPYYLFAFSGAIFIIRIVFNVFLSNKH